MNIQLFVFVSVLCTVGFSGTLVELERNTVEPVGPRFCEYRCELCEDSHLPRVKSDETDLTRVISVINKKQGTIKEQEMEAMEEGSYCVKNLTISSHKRGTFTCSRGGSTQAARGGRSTQDAINNRSSQDAIHNRSNQDAMKNRSNQDAMNIRSNQDAMKNRSNQDAMENRTDQDAVKERTDQDAVKERIEAMKKKLKQGDIKKMSKLNANKDKSKQDEIKKRSKHDSLKGRLKSDSQKKGSREKSEKKMNHTANNRMSNEKASEGRLLFFNKLEQKTSLYQLYFNNYSVAPYPYLKEVKRIFAAAFISSLKKLVFSTFTSLHIASIDSDQHHVVQRTQAGYIKQLSVDETNQLVIMLSIQPAKCIEIMTTNGKNVKMAFKLGKKVRKIATDPKRSTVYVLYGRKKIVPYTYQGIAHGGVLVRRSCHVLMLDPGKDMLYTQGGNIIYKTNLPKLELEMFHDLGVHTDCFYIFDTMFYYSVNSDLYIRNVKLNKTALVSVDEMNAMGKIVFFPVL